MNNDRIAIALIITSLLGAPQLAAAETLLMNADNRQMDIIGDGPMYAEGGAFTGNDKSSGLTDDGKGGASTEAEGGA